ncbi:F-box protein CPR1-like [Bidens hawaiensis]|uniref:F-box protein CPR1-like n=1 Tax=Bidens hawaiensis TaxID=980011 RepID=UPI0040490AD4
MSDHIPFEIQIEIIKKLPIKTLIQCRSVSKPWKSFIDSSDFIADYTVNRHAQPQHHLLIRYDDPTSKEAYVSIVDDVTFPQIKYSLTAPPMVSLLRDSIFVGTSHGLFCLVGYYRNNPCDSVTLTDPGNIIVLWNPLIKKSVAIDLSNVDWPRGTTFGFGVCRLTNDPKIVKIDDVRMHRKMEHWQVEVYSLRSGAWRSSLGNLPSNSVEFHRPHSQVIIGGTIYWFGVGNIIGSGYHLLISFDLSSEEFREIYLPIKLAFHDPTELFLCNLRDSLVVLKGSMVNNKGVYEVWMMEDGDSKLFTNVFTINIPHISSSPLEFRRNGELMMRMIDDTEESSVLVVYEPFSKRINDLGIKGRDSLFVSSYTESLILLDH